MTIPVFRDAGASAGGTDSVEVPPPPSMQENDIQLIIMECHDSSTEPGTPNTPTGWTKLFEETQGAGSVGANTLVVFGKRAGPNEEFTGVVIDGVGSSNNHIHAKMLVFSGCYLGDNPWQVGVGNGSATGNGTVLGLTTLVDDCLIVAIGALSDSVAVPSFTAWTNANLSSLTELIDAQWIGAAAGGLALAGATGDTTVTLPANSKWRTVHIALKPFVPVQEQTKTYLVYSQLANLPENPLIFTGTGNMGEILPLLLPSITRGAPWSWLLELYGVAEGPATLEIQLRDKANGRLYKSLQAAGTFQVDHFEFDVTVDADDTVLFTERSLVFDVVIWDATDPIKNSMFFGEVYVFPPNLAVPPDELP